jgi:methylenetetrahydrofolate reductase (NADPH)
MHLQQVERRMVASMTAAVSAPSPPASNPAGRAAAIADFVRGYSIEATRPTAAEIAELAAILPPGAQVYLSAVARRPPQESIQAAIGLRAAGLEPVPHVAVRGFASLPELDEFLARLSGEAGVERLLVIAGDCDQPAGQIRGAIEAIDGGLLQRRGIIEIGIAGYPEGHPRIAPHDLDRALGDKIGAAEETGLKLHIVTQFCFDPASISNWINRLRNFGIDHPVRIGLAGPTSVATLVRYAARCGVCATAQGLARQAGLMRQLFALSAPDALLCALAEPPAGARLGDVKPHFFSFGSPTRTARWAQAVAARRIAFDGTQGFQVEPIE